MWSFPTILILATLLCSLVAGFLFAFACVVMPGIKTLSDREFIRAFQVIDGVIQNNQPIFMVIWIGSIVALLASVILSFGQLDVIDSILMFFCLFVYLLGVQLPTITKNVPFNNALQMLDVDSSDDESQNVARGNFEMRWNLWNLIRTICASLVSILLMVLLYRQ